MCNIVVYINTLTVYMTFSLCYNLIRLERTSDSSDQNQLPSNLKFTETIKPNRRIEKFQLFSINSIVSIHLVPDSHKKLTFKSRSER